MIRTRLRALGESQTWRSQAPKDADAIDAEPLVDTVQRQLRAELLAVRIARTAHGGVMEHSPAKVFLRFAVAAILTVVAVACFIFARCAVCYGMFLNPADVMTLRLSTKIRRGDRCRCEAPLQAVRCAAAYASN
jgi:hypothetical protein